jgi:hypothetical protein
MRNSIFILSLLMLIFSCGKEIATAIATSPSNLTTAPWRETRHSIDPAATNSEKDALCNSEFGSDYIAGTATEFSGYSNGIYTTGIVIANQSTIFANSSGGTGNYSLFCIHK